MKCIKVKINTSTGDRELSSLYFDMLRCTLYSVGSCLVHVMDDNQKPIAYPSRTLTKAEMACAQIEREGLALLSALSPGYLSLNNSQLCTNQNYFTTQ